MQWFKEIFTLKIKGFLAYFCEMASYIICNCQLYSVNVCKLSNIDPMTTST